MNEARENLLAWLRDAHAMEQQAETMLSSTAERLENYPTLRAKLEAHCEETRQQIRLVRGCLERLGDDPSVFKDIAGKTMAVMQGFSGVFAADEVVKAALASYTFEHMEIASYRILIAAADIAGDSETRRVCETILAQEEAMAKWLGEHLAIVTQEFLRRDARPDTTAKH
ncbi:ferritin-like domain-containing protein [Parapusillimonas sp. SGNA-6]|nr:ferritin-like domain-containing protein [Parapusillimonas sp. SGNA-6]